MLLGTKWREDALSCSPSIGLGSFLMGNIMYVYKEKDIAAEDLYQKRRLVSLISDMGYFRRGTPTYEVDQSTCSASLTFN